jgi:hypothetical protein
MSRVSRSDAYVSIRAHGTRSEGDCSGPDSLVFVDISLESDQNAIRRLPAEVLRNPQAVLLIRAQDSLATAPGVEAGRLGEVLRRWGIKMSAGLLHQPVGAGAWIEPILGEPDVDLARARAIELEALLRWGKAIWSPPGYHYRLPSGEHAPGFIKLSDAIREPRDAEVLASWLSPHLRDGLGFVLDTGTLTPIFEAAANRMSCQGLAVGPVAVLEHYPRTAVDVDDAVEFAAGDRGLMLALLSVNSSGSVRDRLLGAIHRVSGLQKGLRVVVMVDKDRASERPEIETWSPLPGSPPLVRRGARARELCELCTSSTDSRLIAINPYSFDGMSQGELRPVMPSVKDARANRGLWQRCGEDPGAIAVESRSELESPLARPTTQPMAVRVERTTLLKSAGFRSLVADRVARLLGPVPDDPLAEVRWSRGPLRGASDIVLVPAHEHAHEGFAELWAEIEPILAPGVEPLPFPLEGPFEQSVLEQVKGGREILILALGAVSGHSLQRALYAVQDSHREGSYGLQGLVLHARLPRSREWQTLCNSFDGALHAAWITFLPEDSPLRGERDVLKRLEVGEFDGARREFLEERLRLCGGEITGTKPALFWGSRGDARLTANSIFGQRIDARTTFAAVGSAMARARDDHGRREAPEVRVFDLAGMIRSYYDPLIISSFLRWLGPYEAWWGWQSWEAERTIETLFGRIQNEDAAQHILIPELLLATAQGKVHDAAVQKVIQHAGILRERPGLPEEVGAAIDLGLRLAEALDADPARLSA